MSFALDPSTARRAWLQGILFPGLVSLAIIIYTVAAGPFGVVLASAVERAGIAVTPPRVDELELFVYLWLTAAMAVAYVALWLSRRWRLQVLPALLILIAGFGAFLCVVTVAAYVREIQGAGLAWDKTVKTGRVAMPR